MRVKGVIQIDFDSENVTEEKLKDFNWKLQSKVKEEVNDRIYDLAEECGFVIDNLHPLLVAQECEIEE